MGHWLYLKVHLGPLTQAAIRGSGQSEASWRLETAKSLHYLCTNTLISPRQRCRNVYECQYICIYAVYICIEAYNIYISICIWVWETWTQRAVRKSETKMNHFPTASKFSSTQLTQSARNMPQQQLQQFVATATVVCKLKFSFSFFHVFGSLIFWLCAVCWFGSSGNKT